ncbi:MAG: putative heme-binding domain-containing protein [Rhodothermales bacterium]|jgi:putative heme-binding domain-containing protein
MKALLIILFLAVGSAIGQTKATGIKAANISGANIALMDNHDPASELAHFDLLPGYEANLFAAEPMLANPIHMVWDSRGRLWVACSWAYPQLKPGAEANDKIIILEDVDGDGRADKSTTFAEGLYIPTGLELANGGCYVAQSPDIFFFQDTDGDDVADVKELALTGFGIEDSHHSISAWRRGPGGWLYFQEGIFLHTQVETQHGMVHNLNGGVYQFNPRTQRLQVFARVGVGNPWGHVFDRWGQSFLVDNPRVCYLSPSTGNSGDKVRLAKLIQTEKQCGGDLASGTHLPEDIRGQLLTCRFKSRAIIRYSFAEKGAGFSSTVHKPLISSRHPNFRPVDCKMGPDGAVYVADWYNSIINHAQHDFRDARRDHSHGRVWRITAKGRPLVKPPKLHGQSIADLVPLLKSPETWVRHQARLELSTHDRDAVKRALESWVITLDPADAEHGHHLVEAMWACQNVERPSPAILARVIAAKDGHARAAGARVLRYWHADLPDSVASIAALASDPFPRARMEAVLSAGFVPKAEAFAVALHVLDSETDENIRDALAQTMKALEGVWRPALAAGTLSFAKPAHRAYAEGEAGLGFGKQLGSFLKKQNARPDELQRMQAQIVAHADARQLISLIGVIASRRKPKSPDMTLAMLEAIAEIANKKVKVGNRILPLDRLLTHTDSRVAAAAANALGAAKATKASAALTAVLQDASRDETVRIAASRALGRLGKSDSLTQVGGVIAIYGLIETDLDAAAASAAQVFASNPRDVDTAALVAAFVARERGDSVLQKAMSGVTPHPAVSASVSAYHRRTGRLPRGLQRIFTARTPQNLNAALLREDREQLTADVVTLGNPIRGEHLYRQKTVACTGCHAIGPVGPAIGPNLVAVGASSTPSYIVEAILEPNKSIAEHYENSIITTHSGAVHAGVITFKSEKEIALRDAAGREVRIPAASVKRSKALPSLMPDGLVGQLQSRQDFLDLAHFVSRLGLPGPYANDESPVLRKWRISTEKPSDPDLSLPAYSMVSGELPATDLALGEQVYASSFVTVHVPGKVLLKLNKSSGLRLWLNGREVRNLAAPIELNKGRSSFTFLVDTAARGGQGLRVELTPAPGSRASFAPEGGI